jgi:hypothetical protein
VLHQAIWCIVSQLARCLLVSTLLEAESEFGEQIVAILSVVLREIEAAEDNHQKWQQTVEALAEEKKKERPGEPLPDPAFVMHLKKVLESARE